jgi:hypothetical protein
LGVTLSDTHALRLPIGWYRDRRSTLLDWRYRPFFGENATAANSFDVSFVTTEIDNKYCWVGAKRKNFVHLGLHRKLLRKLPMTPSGAAYVTARLEM